MNKFKSLLFSGMISFTLAACGTPTTDAPDTSAPDTASESTSVDSGQETEETRVFTLEELSQYDGKNGSPAYVAVDGVVYDVIDVEPWANGEHKNGITAGNEFSDEILNSPHGKGVLDNLPVVGMLEE